MFPIHDNNPTVRFPTFTVLLCAANLVIFFWQTTLDEQQTLKLYAYRALVPSRITAVLQGEEKSKVRLGEDAVAEVHAQPEQVYSTAVSSMFLHGSWAHVLGNMWFLWLFGNNVEDRLGHIRFLLLYLAGGLAAGFSQWFVDPQSIVPCVGASGAVAAVMGGYIVTWPYARVRTLVVLFVLITMIDLPAIFVLGFWFLMQLLSGVNAIGMNLSGGVAWWAHVGGFVAGAILMVVLKLTVAPPDAHGGRRMFQSFEEPRRFRGSRGQQW